MAAASGRAEGAEGGCGDQARLSDQEQVEEVDHLGSGSSTMNILSQARQVNVTRQKPGLMLIRVLRQWGQVMPGIFIGHPGGCRR